MAKAIGMTRLLLVVDSLLCNALPALPIVDKLDDEESPDDDSFRGCCCCCCCGCCTCKLVFSSLVSALGRDVVLVLGLRIEVNASGELLIRLRSKVLLLGIGTGFFGTLSSADLSSGNDTEVDTGEPFSELLGVATLSAEVVARRLVGTGRVSVLCCAGVVVVVVATAAVVLIAVVVVVVVVLAVVDSTSVEDVKDD